MEKIITGLAKNKPGVLASIADIFKDMDVNINSIATAETDDEGVHHITLVTDATDVDIQKLEDSLSHLMEITQLEVLGQGDHYERELVLVKVAYDPEKMAQIMQLAEVFHAHVIGVGDKSIALEYVAETEQIKGFINMLKPFGLKGVARTGRTALKK